MMTFTADTDLLNDFHLSFISPKVSCFFLPAPSLQRLNKFTVELIGDRQHKQFLFQCTNFEIAMHQRDLFTAWREQTISNECGRRCCSHFIQHYGVQSQVPKELAGVMEYTNTLECFHEMRTLRVGLWSHVCGQATSSMLRLGPSIWRYIHFRYQFCHLI